MAEAPAFLTLRRAGPRREPVESRVQHWREFYEAMPEPGLREQGARCMDCGVPFCQGDTGCPVRNVIPDWNALVKGGRWQQALESLHATNNFPELTGRLCPAPCESACVLGLIEQPVAIRTIEQAIADRGFQEGWITPQRPRLESGRRVAVVGSGPAGLAAAQQLRRLGHGVVVFEKSDRVGGLLFRQPRRVVRCLRHPGCLRHCRGTWNDRIAHAGQPFVVFCACATSTCIPSSVALKPGNCFSSAACR